MLEDFHTEIVAQVLRNSSLLTLEWLASIGATALSHADHVDIQTQEEFAALEGHSSASRPDITIRLSSQGKTELIFIESKLPSAQGEDQLQRYAEQLDAAILSAGVSKTSLVFITRDYESAARPLMANPRFRLTRWFNFYRHLKAHAGNDSLAKEFKHFMEENRMSLGNQFRSTDLVALENFFSAKALMDETLEGEVSESMRAIFGGVWTVRRGSNQFRDHHRYVVSNDNWTDFEYHAGYWLPHDNPDEPAWVGVTIYSKPGSALRKGMIEAFRAWTAKPERGWLAEDLDDASAFSSIYKGKAIQALMSDSDHVRAIKDHLLGLLREVQEFRQTYPERPESSGGNELNGPSELV